MHPRRLCSLPADWSADVTTDIIYPEDNANRQQVSGRWAAATWGSNQNPALAQIRVDGAHPDWQGQWGAC
jgi:hypothetical protein